MLASTARCRFRDSLTTNRARFLIVRLCVAGNIGYLKRGMPERTSRDAPVFAPRHSIFVRNAHSLLLSEPTEMPFCTADAGHYRFAPMGDCAAVEKRLNLS